ncbi:MAG: dihydroorotase family protein [Candidatus Heimdallarchaeota archaeon]|nr:dihydroorotase family protein [Candidatus Heimdallarchaeota archaeon]MCK4876264.1 dihydroorotase family protein [Candidatus Heimdallarchaeota archaeon]
MVEFTNLKAWNHDSKDFVISDLNFSINKSITGISEKEIDGSNFVCLPTGIDIHVHFREPGFTHKEDMKSGTEAALNGGISAVLDMPNTNPITDSVDQILLKRKTAEKLNFVDILIAAAITDGNYQNLKKIDEHCDAYKVFLSESFGNLAIKEENVEGALNQLEQIESFKPIFFHAEDSLILKSKVDEKDHAKQRPPEAEAVAIQSILRWAHDYPSLRFHITHVSSALSLKLLELAALDNLSTDTCPRYLFFDQNSDLSLSLKKVNPPLRSTNDRNQLIEALSKGVIDMISSDHSPHTLEEKETSSPSGMPGVQELIPSLITLVQANEIEWERVIEAFHVFPSKLLNIEQNNFAENCMIVDLSTPFEVDKNWIKSKSKWSPFEGRMLNGQIKYVIKSGEIIHVS